MSVPDFRSNVRRYQYVQVEGMDWKGKPVKIDAEGLLSIVLQHEIDHLNGVLFIDRISGLKRDMYRRKMKKKTTYLILILSILIILTGLSSASAKSPAGKVVYASLNQNFASAIGGEYSSHHRVFHPGV